MRHCTAAGISESDLQLSFIAEFTENDIFPPTDMTEDWFKLIDYDPENVVKISPVRREAVSAAESRRGDLSFGGAQAAKLQFSAACRKHLQTFRPASCRPQQASSLRSPETATKLLSPSRLVG